jgi:hypothetical protein
MEMYFLGKTLGALETKLEAEPFINIKGCSGSSTYDMYRQRRLRRPRYLVCHGLSGDVTEKDEQYPKSSTVLNVS